MVNELEREAGFPGQHLELNSCLALDFLQDSKMFRRLMASMESFFKTR